MVGLKKQLPESPSLCSSCKTEVPKGISKCPYCQTDQRSWFRQHTTLTLLLVLLVPYLIVGVLVKLVNEGKLGEEARGRSDTQITATAVPTKSEQELAQEATLREEERQKTIGAIANTFCETRQGKYSYGIYLCASCVNLGDIVKLFETEGVVNIHNAEGPPSIEDCSKVAEYCIGSWGEGVCKRIAEQKIWLGMATSQLYISWGVPRDKNDTVSSWGVDSQWVYGDFGPYVYLEGESQDDLVVTSWQD